MATTRQSRDCSVPAMSSDYPAVIPTLHPTPSSLLLHLPATAPTFLLQAIPALLCVGL